METKINLNFGWLDLLGIIFIVLKLCKVITWPWVWVLCPIWISLIIVAIMIIAILIINR